MLEANTNIGLNHLFEFYKLASLALLTFNDEPFDFIDMNVQNGILSIKISLFLQFQSSSKFSYLNNTKNEKNMAYFPNSWTAYWAASTTTLKKSPWNKHSYQFRIIECFHDSTVQRMWTWIRARQQWNETKRQQLKNRERERKLRLERLRQNEFSQALRR